MLVSGYFWLVPDTGNWPVQLKYIQMTLFGFKHTRTHACTPLLFCFFLVKCISLFIGSFLSFLSYDPFCLKRDRLKKTQRNGDSDRAKFSQRDAEQSDFRGNLVPA